MDSANSGNGKLPALDDKKYTAFFEEAKDSKLFDVFYQQLKTYMENNNEFNDTVKNNIKWMLNVLINQRKYYHDKYIQTCKDMLKKVDEKEKINLSHASYIQALTDFLEKEKSKNVENTQHCSNYETTVDNLNATIEAKICELTELQQQMLKMEESNKKMIKEKAEMDLKTDELLKKLKNAFEQNEALKIQLKSANQENDNSNKRESTMNKLLKNVQDSADLKIQESKNATQNIMDSLTKNLEEQIKEKDFWAKEAQTFKERFFETSKRKSEAEKLLEITQKKLKEYEVRRQMHIKRVQLATACTEEVLENADKSVASPRMKRKKTSDVLPIEHSPTTASTSNNPILQQHQLQSTSTPTMQQLPHQPPSVIPTTSFYNQNYMYQPRHGYDAAYHQQYFPHRSRFPVYPVHQKNPAIFNQQAYMQQQHFNQLSMEQQKQYYQAFHSSAPQFSPTGPKNPRKK